MKKKAIKLELIEWVAGIKDERTLHSLMLLKKSYEGQDWFETLTPEQLSQVEEGIEDCKQGRVVKSETVWAKYGRKNPS